MNEIIERRDALVVTDGVRFADRVIDVIAVPWEQEAEVLVRGEVWREVFMRGAFDGLDESAGRVPVNLEHVTGEIVGKVVNVDPNHERGLFASLKIAGTEQGDRTLQLASEDMIGVSVGYFVKRGSDVMTNRKAMLRRVKRAFLDHVAMVQSPAFAGAQPIAVHGREDPPPAKPVRTPILDGFLNDDVLTWADSRVGGQSS